MPFVLVSGKLRSKREKKMISDTWNNMKRLSSIFIVHTRRWPCGRVIHKLRFVRHPNYICCLMEIIAGDLRETRHFFGKRAERRNPSKKQKCSRPAVRDGSGYWKLSGKEKRIAASMCNQVIGLKRNLVFCQGRSSDSMKPKWIMQELCLLSHQTTSDSTWLGNQMVSSFLS